MVTEADARVLEYGSTIVLAAGGHVTPLAQDTLRARRITVVARRARRRRRGAGAGGRHPHGGHCRRSHVAGAEGGASSSTCAAAASPRTISAPRPPSRWTIRIPRPPPPFRWRAARPTPASSSTAPGSARRIAANKVRRRARRDVHEPDAGALCAAAQRRQRAGARLHAGDARPRRWPSSTRSSTRRCARRATSAGSPRSAPSSARPRTLDGSARRSSG